MGLDATRSVKYAAHVFTRVRIPGESTIDLQALVSVDPSHWEAYLGDGA